MTTRLRLPLVFWALVWGLALSPVPLLAQQEGLLPLPADPARAQATAPAQLRTTLLTLPFIDDFAGQPEGPPNATRWDPAGGALVNQRFAQTPPSVGVVTFDGLRANGQPYGTPTTFNFNDALTSQPIDLSGVRPADRTFLSFFWQAGTIAGAPTDGTTRSIFLELQFLDNTGTWVTVWRKNSEGVRTDFAQRFIPVDETRFLHAAFRFRFRNFGNQFGTRDSWNLDYILLDRNRDTTNVSYADVVLSRPLTSLLKRYSAMPVWQYNAAANPAQELNDDTFTTFNNLDVGAVPPTPFSWRGQVRVLPNGSETQFLTGNSTQAPGTRQFKIGGSLRNAPLPISSAQKRVEHSIYISLLNQSPNPRSTANDTVRRVTDLTNYYAYDDGTVEATTVLGQNENRATSRAIRVGLNRPDQIQLVRFYYAGVTAAPGVIIPANITLSFSIWAVGPDGLPVTPARVTKSISLPTTVTGGGFRDLVFDQPVPVSGSFFVGYSQPATNLFIQIGADLNSQLPANTVYDNTSGLPGAWTEFTLTGVVPMIRPVMNGIITSNRPSRSAAAVQIYPNPSTGQIQVSARYSHATVLDALGREVWQQPAGEAGQPQLNLGPLPAGVYLLRLTMLDGSISTNRLVLQR